jgi:hypothetical protein
VRHFLLYLHVFGFILWMGGGFAAMSTGILMQQLPRNHLGVAVQVQGRLMRGLILPGAVMLVLSGLILTLRLYGSATSVSGFPAALMVMQAAGLVAAGITLVVSFPAVTRLARLDPLGPHAPLFDALRRRAAWAGTVSGVLGVVALVSGILLR